MPNLYFHHPKNGSFIRVPEQPYHKIYYKYGNGANTYDTDIQEFPKEFRMIAGDATLRALDSAAMGPYGSELGWFCHGDGSAKYPDVNAVGFPKGFVGCPNGLAAAITMPSCWNGKAFDTANPHAHMAYPTADGIQGCPSTHRVARLPQIFIEYWLDVHTFDGMYTAQDSPFVLAMGDATGYGFHVDFVRSYPPPSLLFILPFPLHLSPNSFPFPSLYFALALANDFPKLNGWTPGVLNATMKTCRPGNTGNPPLSDPSCFGGSGRGGVYTAQQIKACIEKGAVNEDVGWTYPQIDNPVGGQHTTGGVLSALPGCQTITTGPQPATLKTC